MSMQLFPSESMVVARGVQVSDATIVQSLPVSWRSASRVVIQEDGTTFLGVPAVRAPQSGAAVMAAVLALPAVAAAIAAREEQFRAAEQAAIAAVEAQRKADVCPAQIISKRTEGIYWAPYMAGYAAVLYRPEAGDLLFSRASDAEAAGYDPAVGLPITRDAEASAARAAELFERAVKAACQARILAVTKDVVTQLNISAHVQDIIDRKASGEEITPENQGDVDMARAIKEWVVAMQDACRSMISEGVGDPSSDAAWPAEPTGARAFVDYF